MASFFLVRISNLSLVAVLLLTFDCRSLSATATTSVCRSDQWVHYEGKCYYRFGGHKISYPACEQLCTEVLSANTLCIEDHVTNDFLYNTFGNAWIGLRDTRTSSTTEKIDNTGGTPRYLLEYTGQNFQWVRDSCSSTYVNWKLGQPNNHGGNQDCVAFVGRQGLWGDVPCDLTNRSICICEEVAAATAPFDTPVIGPSPSYKQSTNQSADSSIQTSEITSTSSSVAAGILSPRQVSHLTPSADLPQQQQLSRHLMSSTNILENATVTLDPRYRWGGVAENVINGNNNYEDFQQYPSARIGHCLFRTQFAPWVQIDLGSPQMIDGVTLWHYWGDQRQYCSQGLKVSTDGETWTTIFDIGHKYGPFERPEGNRHDFDATSVRYLQHYVGPSTLNNNAHFLRIEVHEATSSQPSTMPSADPSAQPSASPASTNTGTVVEQPSASPSFVPSSPPEPSETPSVSPSNRPTEEPVPTISSEPTSVPSAVPTFAPLSCEPGWKSYEDQCFYDGGPPMPYAECQRMCADMVAEMPCIYHKGMENFVLKTFGKGVWMGVEDRNEEGIYKWTNKKCLSDYMPLLPNNWLGTKDEDCFISGSGLGNWHDYPCSYKFQCVCQKPHPSKITPRGSCFPSGQSNNPKCLPYKECEGVYRDGDTTCWDGALEPDEIEYEYLLATEPMTAAEHEAKAQEWNGHLISVHTPYEETRLLHSFQSFGNSLFFYAPTHRSNSDCEAFCYANGATQPCIRDSSMNSYLRNRNSQYWVGVSDRRSEGTLRFTDSSCHVTKWPRNQRLPFEKKYDRVCSQYKRTGFLGLGGRKCVAWRNVDRGWINNDAHRDCAYQYPNNGQWRIGSCSAPIKCVCETGANQNRDIFVGVEISSDGLSWSDGTGYSMSYRPDPDSNSDDSDDDDPDRNSTTTRVVRRSGRSWEDGSWQDVAESYKAAGAYKRRKQLLNVTSGDATERHQLLVPAVPVSSLPLEVRFTSHMDRQMGSYIVEGENAETLSVLGSKTVIFMLRAFLYDDESNIPVLRQVTFTFKTNNSMNDCLFKLCIVGTCERLRESGTYTINIPHPYESLSDLLIFEQQCSVGDTDSVSQVSDLHLAFVSCPMDSDEVFASEDSVVPFCKCRDGYRETVYDTERVDRHAKCSRVAVVQVSAEDTSLEGTVVGIAERRFDHVHDFLVEMKKKIGPSEWVRAAPGDGMEILREHNQIFVKGLQPGRWHSVTMFPRNNESEAVTIDGEIGAISGYAMTHCSCTNKVGEGDMTGTPTELKIEQEEGYVLFTFQDDSLCEDSYAFTREEGGSTSDDKNKKSFTANYYFYSIRACARNRVEPGRQASDNLRISKLVVGNDYSYCVRATARDYMHNPESHDIATSLASSNEICESHRIRWEASVKGRVTLEESAGSLPVGNATITWELLHTDLTTVLRNGTLVTGPGGNFKIVFNEDLVLDNFEEYPVRIQASKQTISGNETIDHNFTCNDGQVDCGNNVTYVYVSHLEFDSPLRIIDTTSVLFSGKVVVGGTDSIDSGDGCGIINAEVCLLDKNAKNDKIMEICVKTNSFGEYEIGAILGTRVIVEIRYNEHQFERLKEEQAHFDVDGIVIEVGKSYSGNDFRDITKAKLVVDVAGGLCDKVLGISRVQVQISGGCDWVSDEYEQTGFRGEHLVPAQVLDVKVVDIFDIVDGEEVRLHKIRDFFLNEVRTIDLRETEKERELIGDQANQTGADAETGEDELMEDSKVRFQWDGVLTTRMIVAGDRVNGEDNACGASDYLYQKTDGETFSDGAQGCKSLHVLRQAAFAHLTLLLQYELKVGVYCDIGNEGIEAQVYNQLGPTEEEKKNSWKNQYNALSQSQKDFLDVCNDAAGGCNGTILHDMTGSVKSRARVEVLFTTGPPNVNSDYLRYVDIIVGQTSHKACFVLEGDFSLGDGDSFALPTYQPIMVLRDPPGGLSYAKYENMETSVSLESSTHNYFTGYDNEFDSLVTIERDNAICAGFGAMVCTALLKLLSKWGYKHESEGYTEKEYDERRNKGSFTTTWSYQTSTDPYYPGSQSDMFVVPNVNVKFMDINTIQWNASICTARNTASQKWAFDEANMEETLSFLPVRSIKETVIPKLKNSIDLLDPDADDYEEKRDAQTTALDHWEDFIEEYEETNELASSQQLSTVPANWFNSTSEPIKKNYGDLPSSFLPDPTNDHWAGLAPLDLVNRARPANQSERPPMSVESHAKLNRKDLLDTHRIHFGGQGGLLTFRMAYDKISEHWVKTGGASDNSEGGSKHGAKKKLGFNIASFGFDLEFLHNRNSKHRDSHHAGESEETSTEVSFVLGDGDMYGTDEFVVDVYTDPRYGTFVFDTVGGQSRCPHETGTLPAMKPQIEVYERPSRPVLPDEPMLFTLRLTNSGQRSGGFELKVENSDNTGNLKVLANGADLARPQTIALGARQSITTTVAIYRGPEDYIYPSLTFVFRDACEIPFKSSTDRAEVSNAGVGIDRKIEFAQPCPEVHWSGDLLRDQEFILNMASEDSLPITVLNPLSSINTFEGMVNNTRLESVILQYREAGDTLWKKAQTMVTIDGERQLRFVNFTSDEDPYGYTTVPWSYTDSGVQDGNWEIRLQTVCRQVSGAPFDFNHFTSNSIHGLIDRVPPAQYGVVDPSGKILPGEEISFQFSERIQCAKPFRFNLIVLVDESDFFDGPVADEVLDVTCEGTRIGIAFDAGKMDLAELVAKPVRITLRGVTDLAGNSIVSDIQYSTEHTATSLDEASVSFEIVLEDCFDYASTGALNEAATARVESEVAGSLGLTDTSRVVIETLSCNVENNKLTTTVTLLPPSAAEGRRRVAEEETGNDAAHAQNLYRLLRERHAANSSGSGVSSSSIISSIRGFRMQGVEVPDRSQYLSSIVTSAVWETNAAAEESKVLSLLKQMQEAQEAQNVGQDIQRDELQELKEAYAELNQSLREANRRNEVLVIMLGVTGVIVVLVMGLLMAVALWLLRRMSSRGGRSAVDVTSSLSDLAL